MQEYYNMSISFDYLKAFIACILFINKGHSYVSIYTPCMPVVITSNIKRF